MVGKTSLLFGQLVLRFVYALSLGLQNDKENRTQTLKQTKVPRFHFDTWIAEISENSQHYDSGFLTTCTKSVPYSR